MLIICIVRKKGTPKKKIEKIEHSQCQIQRACGLNLFCVCSVLGSDN